MIIDLRPADKASAAHIPRAVSIPADSIEKAKSLFPGSKSAPIVLYGDNTASAMPAFDHVRGWGFMNTSILLGGFPAYEKSGMAIAAKSLATEIKYAPKLAHFQRGANQFDVNMIAVTEPKISATGTNGAPASLLGDDGRGSGGQLREKHVAPWISHLGQGRNVAYTDGHAVWVEGNYNNKCYNSVGEDAGGVAVGFWTTMDPRQEQSLRSGQKVILA